MSMIHDIFFKKLFLLFITLLIFSACSSINFNEVSPTAKDFKPSSILILPSIKMPEGTDFDADKLAKIIYKELVEIKKFDRVITPEEGKDLLAQNQELQSNLLSYINKLRTLNISDSELSKKIGEAYGVDAFLVVEANKWGYSKILGEKTAEVNVTIKMVAAATGNIIWQASHGDQEEYSIFKPELTDMARDIIHKIIKNIPIKR